MLSTATTVEIGYLVDLANKQFNRTVESPKPFAFLADSDQQESISQIRGNFQATAFVQDNYRVRVYNPQSK